METTTDRGLGIATIEKRGEMAVSAMAAKSKALVEAKFVIAMHRPRNIMEARAKILDACRRPYFAHTALYAKPVGGQKMIGPSIRFAETAIQCMTNIDVSTTTIFEDEQQRTINIAVTDLESNLSYGKDVTIAKTVERKNLKAGQQPISSRLNSYGEMVYLIPATDDEIQNKISAQESKVIRNCGLRLIPQDIIEEATELIHQTREAGAKAEDPAAATKKICDAFQKLNISPVELEKYLTHSLATVSPAELEDLRDIYTTIKDGEASWSSYVNKQAPEEQTERKPTFGKVNGKPADPNDAPPGAEMPPVATQAPKKREKKPEPTKVTPLAYVTAFLQERAITFSDFVSWLQSTGAYADADSMPDLDALPVAVAEALQKSPEQMEKCAKIFGKAVAK
jgi:hypothetical protein